MNYQIVISDEFNMTFIEFSDFLPMFPMGVSSTGNAKITDEEKAELEKLADQYTSVAQPARGKNIALYRQIEKMALSLGGKK